MTEVTKSAPHTVLADTVGDPFGSLRQRPTSRQERFEVGRALRKQVPRTTLGRWEATDGRRDPVELIRASHQGRLAELIPIRVARMTASPYGFLRGSAVVMAQDVSALPATGITPVICGDAHLGNFGFYASPEGELVLDLNDFDEAHPGGWEWDLRRLVASIWVAGRENSSTEVQCAAAVLSCVSSYRAEVDFLAGQPLLMRSYNRLDIKRLHETATDKSLRAEIARSAKRARNRTSDRALPRFTHEHHGQRQIVEEPPLITHVAERDSELIAAALDDYLQTLAPHSVTRLTCGRGQAQNGRSTASGRSSRRFCHRGIPLTCTATRSRTTGVPVTCPKPRRHPRRSTAGTGPDTLLRLRGPHPGCSMVPRARDGRHISQLEERA